MVEKLSVRVCSEQDSACRRRCSSCRPPPTGTSVQRQGGGLHSFPLASERIWPCVVYRHTEANDTKNARAMPRWSYDDLSEQELGGLAPEPPRIDAMVLQTDGGVSVPHVRAGYCFA